MANEHVINNNLIISGSVTSSVGFAGDGSGLTNITATAEWDGSRDGDAEITGSFIVSGSGANVDFTNAEGGVSGSFSGSFEGDGSGLTGLSLDGSTIENGEFSGSFSGSFQGDGSGLTGLNNFPFTGDAIITGSLTVSGSNVDLTDSTGVSGSFSGSFEGDGSGLTNLPAAEWDGSRDGDASITGSLVVSGSGITVDLKGDTTIDENILISNTGDSTSIGIGSGSLEETTQSRNTIAIGIQAGDVLVSGSYNIYIGNQAGKAAIKTQGDTAVGHQALQVSTGNDTGDPTIPSCNTAIGYAALTSNTEGEKGTAVGANALNSNTTGLCNTALGHEAGCNITTGNRNVTVGDVSGLCVTTESYNTLVGNCSGYRLEGSSNTALGNEALKGNADITNGSNTAVGACAGRCLRGDSEGNVYVGAGAGPATGTTESNKLYINNAAGTPLIKGDFSTSQVEFAGGVSGSFSGSFSGNGAGLTGITTVPQEKYRIFITGSQNTSINTVIGNNVSTDLYSNLLGGASNCSAGDYSSVVGGLANTASADYSIVGAGTRNYLNLAAVSSSILGGFDNTSNLPNTHILGSGITADKSNFTFVNNLDVEGTVSASIFSGSFVGDISATTGIEQALPDGVVSSSLQFNNLTSPFTGSFTGSFTGDGSNLTGISADSIAFDDITGKPSLISSSLQFNDLTSPFTGSFTGSFTGDGSGLTGIAAGNNTEVQFNNNGALGASNELRFSGCTLTIGNTSEGNSRGTLKLSEEDNGTVATIVNGNSELKLYRSNAASALQHGGTSWSILDDTDSTSTTTGAFIVEGGVGIAKNLTVGGRVTANEIVTNVVSQSISFATGSNRFGDEISDTHTFTGSLNVTGSFNLASVINADSDTDKFLVLDSSNNVDFRTGAEVRSDIGAGTGTVTGTGVDNRVAVWSGTTSLDSNSAFTYDGTTLTVGSKATIGSSHTNTGTLSTIAGGTGNIINVHPCSFIGGGQDNQIGGNNSVIGGGDGNFSGQYGFIGGGKDNCANSSFSVIGGGLLNTGSGACSFIGGGSSNTVSSYPHAVIVGGQNNCTNSALSFIGGGENNYLTSANGVLVGGSNNYVGANGNVTLVGGANNIASGCCTFLGGGLYNISCGLISTLVGGVLNTGSGACSFIGGGARNYINTSAVSSSIVGGFDNTTNLSNTHIIGSGITADKADYAYVNNLDVEGIVSGSTLFVSGSTSDTLLKVGKSTQFTDQKAGSLFVSSSGLVAMNSVRKGGIDTNNLIYDPNDGTFEVNSGGTLKFGDLNGAVNGATFNMNQTEASFSNFEKINFTNSSAVSGSVFSGSFVGDGSGLTGTGGQSIVDGTAAANEIAVFNSANTISGSGNLTYDGTTLDTNGFVVLSQVSESLNFVDDTAAAAGGVPLGGLYRSGNFIAIRLS